MSFLRTLFTLSAWFRTRKYKSGTGWCLFRWTETPSDYILRLHVVKTPWFAVCLHWINGPDREPYLHDHPVSFLSLILRGGYTERRRHYFSREDSDERIVVRRWFNFIRAAWGDGHKIIDVKPGTLTLCFMGPKTREWGFHTPTGWEHWKAYNDRVYTPASVKAMREILKDIYSPEKMAELAQDRAPFSELTEERFGDGKYGEGPYGEKK